MWRCCQCVQTNVVHCTETKHSIILVSTTKYHSQKELESTPRLKTSPIMKHTVHLLVCQHHSSCNTLLKRLLKGHFPSIGNATQMQRTATQRGTMQARKHVVVKILQRHWGKPSDAIAYKIILYCLYLLHIICRHNTIETFYMHFVLDFTLKYHTSVRFDGFRHSFPGDSTLPAGFLNLSKIYHIELHIFELQLLNAHPANPNRYPLSLNFNIKRYKIHQPSLSDAATNNVYWLVKKVMTIYIAA